MWYNGGNATALDAFLAARRFPMDKRRSRKSNLRLLPTFLAVTALLAVLWLVAELFDQNEAPTTARQAPLPPSPFLASDFSLINGRMHYNGSCQQGIDVSVHQGQIDWARVAEDGIDFAIVRMGYRGTTEGGVFRDESFLPNVTGAQAVGIQAGAYFFSQAVSVDEAIQEADLAIELLQDVKLDGPVMYDWEVASGGRTDGLDYATVTACAVAFCQRLEDAGYEAGVYFNLEMAKYLHFSDLKDYTLWVADYNESPRFDYTFSYWQYSATGSVSGITGDVDLNLYFPSE